MVHISKCSFILTMARARIFITLYIFIQAGNRLRCSVVANTLTPKQVAQSNVAFNTQNTNQNFDSVKYNTQTQQNARTTSTPQQSLNLHLGNIPMQTFNVQQPGNHQHQGSVQSVNCQTVNPAIHLQQVPQHFNMKQDVPQQTLPHSVNLHQATIVPINSPSPPNVNVVQQSAGSQQSLPVQGLNLQQLTYTVNNPQQPAQVQSVNFQQQTSPQSISLQQPVLVQPVNFQQQILPQDNNLHQQSVQNSGGLTLQSAPLVTTASSTPIIIQQSPIVQPLNYQQSAQKFDLTGSVPLQQNQIPSSISPLQQFQSSQQLPREQFDSEQIPINNIGGCQVISYQKPCHQNPEITTNLPVPLQLSTLPLNSNPTIVAAEPAVLSNANTAKQSFDYIYLLTPQNYLTSLPYSPIVVTENLQPTLSTSTIVPVMTNTNIIPSSFINQVNSNNNQISEIAENWTSSSRLPDFGMFTGLQEQFPIASMLQQSTSPIQSAVLSSILSAIQNPSISSPYVMSSNYPVQTIFTSHSNSQGSKLNLKCLLPLLIDLLQEKYTNHGCQCNCCNCQCSPNHNNLSELQMSTECLYGVEENITKDNLKQNDVSAVIEETHVNSRQRKEENYNRNVIPDDSTEVDDTENSSCEDEDENDVAEDSGEENDTRINNTH